MDDLDLNKFTLICAPMQPRPLEEPRRVVVDDRYTYEIQFEVELGEYVVLPGTDRGVEWIGKVTALTSSYAGFCRKVIRSAKHYSWTQRQGHRQAFDLLRESIRQDYDEARVKAAARKRWSQVIRWPNMTNGQLDAIANCISVMVAKIVGGGTPEADDFLAELMATKPK